MTTSSRMMDKYFDRLNQEGNNVRNRGEGIGALIRRATEAITQDSIYNSEVDRSPATTEFKRYLREMNGLMPYDRFEGENMYARLYRELGYGDIDSVDVIDEVDDGQEEIKKNLQVFGDYKEELL